MSIKSTKYLNAVFQPFDPPIKKKSADQVDGGIKF